MTQYPSPFAHWNRLITALTLISALPAAALAETPNLATGFEMPESVLVLPDTGHIVVSNIKGDPFGVDGNGYLSLLSPDGTVISQHWATGMDAPKGMAVIGDRLVVADLQQVHIVDIKDGAVIDSLTAPQAGMLNDVTTDENGAWISDFVNNAIYRYEDDTLSVFMEGGALSHPNGLLYENGALVVGNWGVNLNKDFTTDLPGSLLSIDVQSKEVTELTQPFANIDGVVRLGDQLVVSDWLSGKLYSIDDQGDVSTLAQYHMGLADIGAYEGTLYLPFTMDGDLKTLNP